MANATTATGWTFEEFLANAPAGYKCEWVEGRVIMSPVRRRGFKVQHRLLGLLEAYVERHGLGEVGGEQAILSGPAKGRVPDLYFVRRARIAELLDNPREMLAGVPDLVIEILSERPRDQERDRVLKLRQYFEGGAEEYWLVDLEAQAVEVYERGEGGFILAERREGEQDLRTPLLPGLVVPLGELWREMELPRQA